MTKDHRRESGTGGLYQRDRDGHWVGSVDLEPGPDGKRRRKSVSSKNKRDALKKLQKVRREIEQHGDLITHVPTTEQWLRYWITDIAPARARPSTVYGYSRYIENYLVPQLGRYRLNALRAEHVRAMLASMATLSEATRRQAFAILQRALEVAHQEGKIRANVCKNMDGPKQPKVHRKPFLVGEALTILRSLDPQVDAAAASRWQCALLLGLRQGEALGLRWDHVDLDARRIHIVQSLQRRVGIGLVLVEPKSDTSIRTIPMLPEVHLSLSLMPSRMGYVWGGESPTDPRKDWQDWRDLLTATGVPLRPLHAARNTTASLLDKAGASPVIIKEILGHAHVAVSQSAYIRGDEGRHIEAMESLSKMLDQHVSIPQPAAPPLA
jgi:integrase